MKQCPACRTTYTDRTLSYCLADGAALTDLDREDSTVIKRGGENAIPTVAINQRPEQIRIDVQPITPPTAFPTGQTSASPAGGSVGIFRVILAVIGLGILGLLALGVGGLIYFNMSRSETPANREVKAQPPPTPAKDEKDELRDQIANLEKRLNEQKKTGQPANVPFQIPNQTTTTPARVDSPGDGFLALRTLPSSEVGERIVKIRHGALIAVGACGPVVAPVKRSGRWCQASYNGYSGWVFDAYLIY
jgi:hypothetical protein